jgi:uncharacterized circularly permuted ATP-grasp superfamily protein/uncharacterized alpha-E superfamily protein
MSSPTNTRAFASPFTGARDEAYDSDGSIKPHWRHLLHNVNEMGADAINVRQVNAQQLLRDDGATYRVYSHDDDEQSWQLDPIPFLINSNEWAQLEKGLIERAELLNLLLSDIYGERRLIRDGVIPPELIVSQPSFLRACHRVPHQSHHPLVLHSADVVRAPDGCIYVMSDRTQAPSGAGYALENRSVITRAFPTFFHANHVISLSSFFTQLHTQLDALNPNGGIARIVVLTPGSYNEAYFEHAYLANQLGAPLVQGNDLIVRNGYVWLKTLDGLKRVDVILRRVDDVYCDPVELQGESQLGVAGLMEVIRNGRVGMANPLGSGILENSGLLRYLPAIANALLGRTLQLPSITTWWCGDKNDCDYVCNNLRSLVIKSTYRRAGRNEIFGAELDDNRIRALIHRIRTHPHHYAAQVYIPASTSPTWNDSHLQPRPTLLRTFSVANKQSYAVMPGGLTRVNISAVSNMISNQHGSRSKDTWVLTTELETRTRLSPPTSVSHKALSIELPSRVIENVFWFGRYTERAEACLRVCSAVLTQLTNNDESSDALIYKLLCAVTHVTGTYPGFTTFIGHDSEAINSEMISIITSENRIGSVAYNLLRMMRAAGRTKEHLSNELQRNINNVDDQRNQLVRQTPLRLLSNHKETLYPIASALLTLKDSLHNNMPHDSGWHFIVIGQQIECALYMINSVRALLTVPMCEHEENALVETCLASTETLTMYKHYHQKNLCLKLALDMMLLQPSNPHSLIHHIEQLSTHLRDIANTHNGKPFEMTHVDNAKKLLKHCNLNQLAMKDPQGQHVLFQLLTTLHAYISLAATAIAQHYFSSAEGLQLLVTRTSRQQ